MSDLFSDYNKLVSGFKDRVYKYALEQKNLSELKSKLLNLEEQSKKLSTDKTNSRASFMQKKKAEFIEESLKEINSKIQLIENRLITAKNEYQAKLSRIDRETILDDLKRSHSKITELKDNSDIIDQRFKDVFGESLYSLALAVAEKNKRTNGTIDLTTIDIDKYSKEFEKIQKVIKKEAVTKKFDGEGLLNKLIIPTEKLEGKGTQAYGIYLLGYGSLFMLAMWQHIFTIQGMLLGVVTLSCTSISKYKKLFGVFIKSHSLFENLDEVTQGMEQQADKIYNARLDKLKEALDLAVTDCENILKGLNNKKELFRVEASNKFNEADYEEELNNYYKSDLLRMKNDIDVCNGEYSRIMTTCEVMAKSLKADYKDSRMEDRYKLMKGTFLGMGVRVQNPNTGAPEIFRFRTNSIQDNILIRFDDAFTVRENNLRIISNSLGLTSLYKAVSVPINKRTTVIFYEKETTQDVMINYIKKVLYQQISCYTKSDLVKYHFIDDTAENDFKDLKPQPKSSSEAKELDKRKIYNFYNQNNEGELQKYVDSKINFTRDMLLRDNLTSIVELNEAKMQTGSELIPYDVMFFFNYSNLAFLTGKNFRDLLVSSGGSKGNSNDGDENKAGVLSFVFLNENILTGEDRKINATDWIEFFDYIHKDNIFKIFPETNDGFGNLEPTKICQLPREQVFEKLKVLENN